MRGAYTAGVIDALLENDIDFEYCYGVSSGATHATTYLSKQYGRAIRIVTEHVKDKRYFSFRNLLLTGSMFGVKFLFHTIPRELDPYDYETAKASPTKFYVGVINLKTGAGEYLHVKNIEEDYMMVCASMSLPIISRAVKINGQKYLDGGISDSLPIQRSIDDGNKKTVLVLTQDATYRKGINRLLPFITLGYFLHPRFIAKIATRHIRYNKALEQIKAEEEAGRAFVFRPKYPVKIGRLEVNMKKMMNLYREGYEEAIELMPEFKKFLEA